MRREKSPPPKILIIDDDEFIRLLYKSEFEEEGFAVTTASTARQALKLVASDPPDIAILDIKMPDMNGIDVREYSKKCVSSDFLKRKGREEGAKNAKKIRPLRHFAPSSRSLRFKKAGAKAQFFEQSPM